MFELCTIEVDSRAIKFYGNELGQIIVTGTDGSKGVIGDIRHPIAAMNLPGGESKTVRDFLYEVFENMPGDTINKYWEKLRPYYNAIYE